MATYSTPGVYVKEITKFPPSVAQVETAIPAFIGYTEYATKKTSGDLDLVPMRISSLLEYQSYFGGAENETVITASVDENGVVTAEIDEDNRSEYLMYYSLQMYFANGGGPCYITSVGQYGVTPPTITMASLKNGLDEIRRMDEPTLLLFPDATSMAGGSHNEYYSLCNDALTQCNELQDRFAIFDTFSDVEYSDGVDSHDPIEEFRNKISSEKDYAKYGAVYFPYLETILDYVYEEEDVDVTLDGIDLSIWLSAAIATISTSSLGVGIAAVNAMDYSGPESFTALKATTKANIQDVITALGYLKSKFDSVLAIGREEDTDTDTVNASNVLDTWITDNIEALQLVLNSHLDTINPMTSGVEGKPGLEAENDAVIASLSSIVADMDTSVASGEVNALSVAVTALTPGATTVSLDTLEGSDNELYNKIKLEISQIPIYLPPSSAVAGIYARIDKNNGVWKAPANVGLNYVVKPTINISHDEQASMNVHTTGKSVNAIRTFTGKGILVWGARTLAGNDNEWRYVPVRRFFNMVEESVKKASEQFVFEGNDANTWVRIRAMIENFLNLQWRAGALTGAKPEQAYYVRVGLGQTMTAEDILNGYMNIEIGMAVVRPAEFIVLKFSHKMQEA